MRVFWCVVATAMLGTSVQARAYCPYAVVDIEDEPATSVDVDGALVLRWKGQSVIYDPITVADLDVQVVVEKQAFSASYSITNESQQRGQRARLYFYFENPMNAKPSGNAFVSAGLLGGTGPVGELGRLPPECQLYKRTNYPSESFGDFTSRHDLRRKSTQAASVQGALRIRGDEAALRDLAPSAVSHPPKLKMLIYVAEAR